MRPSRRAPIPFFAVLLLAAGCHGGGEKDAHAAEGPGAAHKPAGVAKGEYKDLKTGKVEKGDVAVVLPEVGTLAPVTSVAVKSVLSGRVVRLLVKEGDAVRAGQPLAQLEPGVDQLRELSAIASGVETAALELKDAKVDYENAMALSGKGFASADQVKAAEKRLREAEIHHASAVSQRSALAQAGVPMGSAASGLRTFNVVAPSAGTVLEKKVEIGDVVTSGVSGFNAGTVLFDLADAAALKVDAFINEIDLGKISVGLPVKITVDAFRGREFEGEVATISPSARQQGEVRGFDVEIRFKGDAGPLRPGMTANVDIRGDEKKDVVRIPVQALFKDKGEDVVWRIQDGAPDRFPVKPGLVSLEWVEIPSGLDVGADIALESPQAFLDEQKEDDRQQRRRRRR